MTILLSNLEVQEKADFPMVSPDVCEIFDDLIFPLNYPFDFLIIFGCIQNIFTKVTEA